MNAPFLPEPEVEAPAPGSKTKSTTKRTLILWLVLIAMFLGIWQFLTPATGVRPTPTPVPVSSGLMSWPLVFTNVFFILAIIVGVTVVRRLRADRTFNLAQEPGRIALSEGRFREAADRFRETLARYAKQPMYRAVGLINVGEALLRSGRLREALATFAEVERARLFGLGTSVRVIVGTKASLVHALLGDLPEAETWIASSRARLAKNRDDRLLSAAHLRLAEAVLACRNGNPAGATALLEERWLTMRYVMTSDAMRIVEIVRAYAEAQGDVRSANVVAERLVRIEPVVRGEFDYLGVAWPEMQTFLAAHQLAGTPA